tara:strand:+ start:474 stop:923 length:450 start_codon:yes stop_codon:yes gene_type:complete
MKKSELKKVLKPLIKECIKEVIFEEGVLSGIITEVAQGMSGVRTEAAPTKIIEVNEDLQRIQRNAFNKQSKTKLQDHKSKLMAAIGGEAFNGTNLFEGTTPTIGESSMTQQSAPMSGVAPTDTGVDISDLVGTVGRNWTAHMSGVKERK